MVDVYKTAQLNPEAENKGKVLSLWRLFPPEEPSRKRFINEVIAWSSSNGEYPAGDPELHHVAGSLYAEENEAYDAERHLILGTKDSTSLLVRLEYDWYTEDDASTAPLYAARAVLPYLLIGNVRDATRSLQMFTSRLTEGEHKLAVQDVSSGSADIRIFPSLPLLNFLGLLLLAVPRGSADVYRLLQSQYAGHVNEAPGWPEALEQIGEMYFGIPIQRQTNPLLDMMGGLFGGGTGGAPQPKSRRVEQAPQPADLD
ncbi:MAG: hypothetical protein M1832_005764 [Thelocarpon impressellum]|nr:MAG: hypothetical protein M1832_005764 [Thelocarpon impressellum]